MAASKLRLGPGSVCSQRGQWRVRTGERLLGGGQTSHDQRRSDGER